MTERQGDPPRMCRFRPVELRCTSADGRATRAVVGLVLMVVVSTAGGLLVTRAFGSLALVVYTSVELAVIIYSNHRWVRGARRTKAH